MQYRKHYRCVGEKGLSRNMVEKMWKNISVEEIIKYQDKNNEDPLTCEDIGIKKFKINHGLNDKHPLNNVKFFDKKSYI